MELDTLLVSPNSGNYLAKGKGVFLLFHFGSYRNFKHYYLSFIKLVLKKEFPTAVSYNRFVELEGRVFFQMMFFLNLQAFGR